jgi:hypothetical protein
LFEEGSRDKLFEVFQRFEGVPKGIKLSEIYSKIDSKLSISLGKEEKGSAEMRGILDEIQKTTMNMRYISESLIDRLSGLKGE